MCVTCFLNQSDLYEVDVVNLCKVLKLIGYVIEVGNGVLVKAHVGRFESKEHIKRELLMDVQSLLRRFKLKK